MNRNKLGLTLDPMLPEGQEVVRKLVATAGRSRRQPAAADARGDEARLREPVGREAGYHPDDGHGVRPRWTLQRAGGLRRYRPGHVGGGIHDGHRGPALSRAGALGRLRHGAALRPSAPWRR
jgi:hypothetical protein